MAAGRHTASNSRRAGATGVTPAEPGALPQIELSDVSESATRLRGGRRGFVLRRFLTVSDFLALFAAYGAMLGIRELLGRVPLGHDDLIVFSAFVPVWFALGIPLKLYHVG